MFAYEIVEAVKQQKQSVQEVVRQALAAAHDLQASHNAFITICDDAAMARAKQLDDALLAGENLGSLAGVPIVVKDNICTKGILTTAASKSLETFVPPYNATVIERLLAAGAVIVAKANLDEFGMGSGNENSAYGACGNAWDATRVAGGSSGGSAVAVAKGIVPLALGTDTGGSVRRPAALNGVLGYKPTYGMLSRYGVIAYASSLDQVGVFARSNKDIALAMAAMLGHDKWDATSLPNEKLPDMSEFLARDLPKDSPDLSGLRIGVVQEFVREGINAEVQQEMQAMLARLEQLGAELKKISLESARYGVAAYYLVAQAEASSNLARYDGMIYSNRQGENALGQAEVMMRSRGATLGHEVRRRILTGTYALSAGYYDAYYGKALKVRRVIADAITKAFETVDILAMPTAMKVAQAIAKQDTSSDPMAEYLDDVSTVLANLAGIGAINIPAGKATDGLPCGVQFHAPALEDARLFKLSQALEQYAIQQGEEFAPIAS